MNSKGKNHSLFQLLKESNHATEPSVEKIRKNSSHDPSRSACSKVVHAQSLWCWASPGRIRAWHLGTGRERWPGEVDMHVLITTKEFNWF